MVEAGRGRVKGVLTIGADAALLAGSGRGPAVHLRHARGAVARARELAAEGDTVLLAGPARRTISSRTSRTAASSSSSWCAPSEGNSPGPFLEGIPPAVRFDPVLLGAVFLLLALGLVMVYSASAVLAQDKQGDSLFLKRQLVAAGWGWWRWRWR